MEKISRLMDGDVPQNELPTALRNCGDEGREAWQMYHLIGDALRNEVNGGGKAGTCPVLYSQICAAIAQEPNVFVPAVAKANRDRLLVPVGETQPLSEPQAEAARSGRWLSVGNGAPVWKPWAIAASVATAAVVGWQTLVTQPREAAAARAVAAQTQTPPGASTVASGPVMQVGNMNRYINAHTEAAPVTRLSGPRVYSQPVSSVTH